MPKRLKAHIGSLTIKGQKLQGNVTDEQYNEALATSDVFKDYFEEYTLPTPKPAKEPAKVKDVQKGN